MLRHNFQATSPQGDWQMPFLINAAPVLRLPAWSGDEVVELHISPDAATWDDYGIRRSDPPPAGARVSSAIFQARSGDGTNIVLLRDPAAVQVIVPARIMAGFGPGVVNVGVHFERLSTGQRATLLAGRLPIVSVA